MNKALVRDTCARLPYGLMVRQTYHWKNEDFNSDWDLTNEYTSDSETLVEFLERVDNMKPFLRPMSSMTEEEHGQYMEFIECPTTTTTEPPPPVSIRKGYTSTWTSSTHTTSTTITSSRKVWHWKRQKVCIKLNNHEKNVCFP